MSHERRMQIFDYWFKWYGHWMFGVYGKERALEAWITYGIDGLPDYC